MKREQRTIQVWKVLWTYKESLEGSDRSPEITEVSNMGLTGITDGEAGKDK